MDVTQTQAVSFADSAGIPRRQNRAWLNWVGVVPFVLYIAVFLIAPALGLVVGAFQSNNGGFTLSHVNRLLEQQYIDAYILSVKLSLVTAFAGTIIGGFVAYAAVKEGSPRWIRTVLTTFSGVAANFAGIPLAFAFMSTLGLTGIITVALKSVGVDLYATGFTLYSFAGLSVVYLYFQIPLMILVITPSLDGMRKEWREAATNLGTTPLQFWRWVGLPILWPAILGAFVLLFGNAFAAYATAYTLVGSAGNLVPVLIGDVVSGDLVSDPQFGDALAMGMVLVIVVTMTAYFLLQRQAGRWLQ